MLTLDQMIDDVLKREGSVYENHPADSGGPTKFGITLGRLRTERGKHMTWLDVKNLTEPEARAIYKDAYYFRPKIDQLPDGAIEIAVFDWYVNSGTWGIKGLQKTLTAFGYKCDVDGAIGPQTVRQCYACLTKVPESVFLAAYLQERRRFYDRIVASRPSQRVFLRGWYNRVAGLEKQLITEDWRQHIKRAA
jgi:lysozyme family protein